APLARTRALQFAPCSGVITMNGPVPNAKPQNPIPGGGNGKPVMDCDPGARPSPVRRATKSFPGTLNPVQATSPNWPFRASIQSGIRPAQGQSQGGIWPVSFMKFARTLAQAVGDAWGLALSQSIASQ